jgi:hypothetical protein
MNTGRPSLAGLFVTLTACVVALFTGCGGSTDVVVVPDGGDAGAATPQDGAVPGARDASPGAQDAGRDAQDASPGGMECSDVTPCPVPASTCVDQSTLRWYSAVCDNGVCRSEPHDEPCPAGEVGSFCSGGGCVLVVLR